MSEHVPLRGSCQCGRNQYLIRLPENVSDHAHVYFDSSQDNRRFHGSPLTAWLRVPLSWYQSHTQSYFPDETHASIRRIFSPYHAPHTQRVFCGFCGTPLTYWSEVPRDEADYMSVSLGSLFGEHQRKLEDLDLLPPAVPSSDEEEEEDDDEVEEVPRVAGAEVEVAGKEDEEEQETYAEHESEQEAKVVAIPATASGDQPTSSRVVIPALADGGGSGLSRSYRQGTLGGIPWFEEMIEGSQLGRLMKMRRGVGVSDDHSTTVEWEISEWSSDAPGAHRQAGVGLPIQAGKRKRGV
ncbi:uncharacterized protein BP01DRAFT_391479 [Aspergillus saccharolyticus JOP 1030-1]|uniref:CENP-V/GFA domain-containing protein n=1 Tax=Aspergillus saccharolyticus JOP 1030-1 TaxID=1450539 RepID=A0A318ZEA3_9EURO|nr:hypothetical protein BP01DRAFT_391479 [Aspergillus saccharolyticus JOP 1030-1]PYH45709.1 hypothetical protein BP01DRAFT_391479 [Aspergillus saccharolyticus JOP 1030-1]